MDTITEKKLGDYTIKIVRDDDPQTPDEWGDDSRFLVFDHRQFYVAREGFSPTDIFENNEKEKGYFVFRCYAYIHSGVSLSVGSHNFPDARWDVSFKGFFLIKREKGTWTRNKAEESAQGLCASWNEYLSGDACGYHIFDAEGDDIESCYGFYDSEECMKEAESIVEHLMES